MSLNYHHWILIKFYHENILYKFDPLKRHFYTVKQGLQGYTLFFFFLLKNIDCGYSLDPEYLQSMFCWVPAIYVLSRNMKNIRVFFIWNFSVFGGEIFYIFE